MAILVVLAFLGIFVPFAIWVIKQEEKNKKK